MATYETPSMGALAPCHSTDGSKIRFLFLFPGKPFKNVGFLDWTNVKMYITFALVKPLDDDISAFTDFLFIFSL